MDTIKRIRCSIINCLEDLKYLKTYFFIILAIYTIVYFPLLLANITYIDDNIRNLGLGGDRFISEGGWVVAQIFLKIFSGGNILFDTSPIRQLVGIFFIALSSCILINVIYSKKNFNIFVLLSSIVIGITPTAIRLICHKYDSVHYGFAIFSALFPFLFYKKNIKIYLFVSIIFVTFSFMSYHAMSGIYPSVVVFLSLLMFIENEDINKILKFILYSFISFVISLLIYGVILFFVQNTNELIRSNLDNNLLFNYFLLYSNIFKQIFNMDIYNIKIFILILIVFFVIIYILISKRNKVVTFILLVLSLLLISIIQFGYSPLIIQEKFLSQGISPGYIYGYSITLSIILIQCVGFFDKMNISFVLSFIIVLYLCVSCVLFGRILFLQKEYNFTMMNIFVKDLSDSNIINDNHKLFIKLEGGGFGVPPEIEKIIEKFPEYSLILPSGFSKSWPFPSLLLYYFDSRQVEIFPSEFDYKDISNMKLYKENDFYKIFIDNKDNATNKRYAYIEFKL